jgi:transcription factor WhiB
METTAPDLSTGSCRPGRYLQPAGALWPFDTDMLRGKDAAERMEARTARAKQICGGCPVRDACLSAGIAQDHLYNAPEGIWGGMLPEERAELQGLTIRWVSGNRRYAALPPRSTKYTSKYRGVTYCHRKSSKEPTAPGFWQAQLKTGGKNHYLGRFATETEAARAYNAAAPALLGPKAILNEVPDED